MQSSGSKTHVILIGIDEYNHPGSPNLQVCLEDVRGVKQFLDNAFTQSDMTVLTSPLDSSLQSKQVPTLVNVINAFDRLIRNVTAKDSIYIYFTGHGSRIPTKYPGLKGQGSWDESLVFLPDSTGRNDVLSDIEVATYLKRMTDTGATVTLLLDCCFAGGATRTSNIDTNESTGKGISLDPATLSQRDALVPPEIIQATWRKKSVGESRSSRALTHWLMGTEGVEFMAACRDDEIAWPMPRGHPRRSVFTHCLLETLNHHRTHVRQMTCSMIFNQTCREKERSLAQQYLQNSQNFVFGGKRHRRFLDGIIQPPTEILVSSLFTLASGITRAEFDTGSVHGAFKGQKLAIYAPGTTFANILDYSQPLATYRLDEVKDWTSRGNLDQNNSLSLNQAPSPTTSQSLLVQVKCKAVHISSIPRRVLELPKNVTVGTNKAEPSCTEAVKAAKAKLAPISPLIQVTDSNGFFHVDIVGPDDVKISFRLHTKSGTQSVVLPAFFTELRGYLSHLAVYTNITSLGTPGSHPSPQLVVEAVGTLPSSTSMHHPLQYQTPTPFAHVKDPLEVNDGEHLVLRIGNRSSQTLFLEALCIEPSGCIDRFYPQEGKASVQLTPNGSAPLYVEMSKNATMHVDLRGGNAFDTILILATVSETPHFPAKVLPELQESRAALDLDELLCEPRSSQRSSGSISPTWFVKQVRVRIM